MFAQDLKVKVLQEQSKDIILKVKMQLTVTQFLTVLQVQQDNVNFQEEYLKVRKWQGTWEMKWLQEKIFK